MHQRKQSFQQKGPKLLLGTSNAELVALSAIDGALVWKTVLSSEILALPRVEDGMVIVRTSDGRITALDEKTGATRWSYERTIPALSVRTAAATLTEIPSTVAT